MMMKKKYPRLFTALIIILFLVSALVLYKMISAKFAPVGKGRLELNLKLIKWFPFTEAGSLKEWEEKVFKGKVVYTVEKTGDLSYVKAKSSSAASALYYKVSMDARHKNPLISWRWKVEKFPDKKMSENLETQDEDDFAARVYVIFPAKFLLNSKVLEYIWAKTIPAGTTGTSPYSKNIKLIVARSGEVKPGEWYFEERDIVADYLKVFGRMPEHDLGAVAFMTNTEHTGTSADAMYDEIKLGYKEGRGKQ